LVPQPPAPTDLLTSGLELLATPARQAAVLEETGHRLWPIPGDRWTLAQTWDDLMFAHWRVDFDAVRELVPEGLELDRHDGSSWLGITPFVISGFRLRGTPPLPRLSTFPELNVRTYVTAEDKPGIWFFSLDTSSPLAVAGARRAYRLPYHLAQMRADRRAGRIEFSSTRKEVPRPFVFKARYAPAGRPSPPEPGSLEHFLTERYCLYAEHDGKLHRAEIHHPPWPLQDVEAELELNTMAPDGIDLRGDPLCHFSRRQDVVIWGLEPV
jgi:uncharacterized protein YqjF (DUF2071 family)